MDYEQLAQEFFRALSSRPHGPCSPGGREQSKERNRSNDPSKGEFPVMRYLLDSDRPVLPSQISAERHLTSARIANILTGLEKKGLIRRQVDPEDRRKVWVELTEHGRVVTETIHREAIEDVSWLLRQMGEKDAEELIRLEWKMTEIIRRSREKNDD